MIEPAVLLGSTLLGATSMGSTTDAARGQLNTLMLVAASLLVLVMVVGTSYFYGSFRRRRESSSSSGAALGTVGLVVTLWVFYGYGLAFGPSLIPGFLGNPAALFFELVNGPPSAHTLAFAGYQLAVAILTVTFIASAIAGRARLRGWLLFVGVWVTLVYAPLAYAVFNVQDGWIFTVLQVNDQAGGTVIAIGAGASALALLIVSRRAVGPVAPGQTVSMTLVGVVLMWVGWFGLNVGSESVVDGLLGPISINTLLAPAAAILAWVVVEVLRSGRPTVRGAASGAVAGLVAITPACNILTPDWALLLGALAGAVCALAVSLKKKLGFDDGFDIVGIFLTGGILGMLYVGLFGTGIGWRDNGQPERLIAQAEAAIGVALYAFVLSFAIAWVIKRSTGSLFVAGVPVEKLADDGND